MNLSDIDFTFGWSIKRHEYVIGHSISVNFPEPLNLSSLMKLRKAIPTLQNKSISELKESMIGLTEYSINEIKPDQLSSLRRDLGNQGFTIKVASQAQIQEYPVYTRGTHSVYFTFSDSAVASSIMNCCKDKNVPVNIVGSAMDYPVSGSLEEALIKIKQHIDYKPRELPSESLPEFKPSIKFKYIDESILKDYIREDYCPVCDQFAHVIWLLRDVIVDGEEFDVDYICFDCLAIYPVTEYNASDTKNSIASYINKYYPKGQLTGVERAEKVDAIFDEFIKTPKLPNFIQNVDWPMCCGDFTKFVGDAGKTYTGSLQGFEWYGYENDIAKESGIEEMIGGEDRVSLFSCSCCDNRFWTFQYT